MAEFRLYSEIDFRDLNSLPQFSVVVDSEGYAWQFLPWEQDQETYEWSHKWLQALDPLARVQEFDGPFRLVYLDE